MSITSRVICRRAMSETRDVRFSDSRITNQNNLLSIGRSVFLPSGRVPRDTYLEQKIEGIVEVTHGGCGGRQVCGRIATTAWLCRTVVCACFIPSHWAICPMLNPPLAVVRCDHSRHSDPQRALPIGRRLVSLKRKSPISMGHTRALIGHGSLLG